MAEQSDPGLREAEFAIDYRAGAVDVHGNALAFARPEFLSHLHSYVATMSQKSTYLQNTLTV
jgi:hypothetical protein